MEEHLVQGEEQLPCARLIKRGKTLNPRLLAVYLGFGYRSVQEPERRGFAMKPTAKYVECLDKNAKPVVMPLTEQKSPNLHGETAVCDQAEHAWFRAVVGKSQFFPGVRPDLLFVTKCLSHRVASPTFADFDTCEEHV